MQLRRYLIIVILVIFCLQGCGSARRIRLAEELQASKLSFAAGNFKKAFLQLIPLAAEGCVEAQYAVGYMYYYGYGVPHDEMSGLFWIRRAAACGYPAAMRALQLIQKCPDCGVQPKPPPGAKKYQNPTALTKNTSEETKKYALQLVGSYDLDAVKILQKKLKVESAVWQTTHNGRDWYVLTYGAYPAFYQAKVAVDELPADLQSFKSWPRNISGLIRV